MIISFCCSIFLLEGSLALLSLYISTWRFSMVLSLCMMISFCCCIFCWRDPSLYCPFISLPGGSQWSCPCGWWSPSAAASLVWMIPRSPAPTCSSGWSPHCSRTRTHNYRNRDNKSKVVTICLKKYFSIVGLRRALGSSNRQTLYPPSLYHPTVLKLSRFLLLESF